MSAHLAKGQSIRIPRNARIDRTGYPTFRIATEHGGIDVEFGRSGSLFCRGTPEAVIAFGLIEPQWLPGAPGNNATAQVVYFEESGPRLLFGKNRRGKRPTSPRIIVRAWGFSQRTVDVKIPLSEEQAQQFEAFCDDSCTPTEVRGAVSVPAVSAMYRTEGNVIYLAPRHA